MLRRRSLVAPLFVAGLLAVVVVPIVACSDDPDTGATPPVIGGSSGGEEGEEGAEDGSTAPPGKGDSATAPPIATVTNETMNVGGAARTYVLVVPREYDAAKKYPLVVIFHGQPGNAAGMHQYYPMEKVSQQEAILVYPDGTNNEWNLFEPPASNGDVKFIQALVDALAAKYSIDKARIFGDGYSNGAFFVNQLACRLGLFKAIGNSAGGAPADDPDGTIPCTAVKKMPAIVMHGDKDFTVGVESGRVSAEYWAGVNACGGTLTATTPTPCKAFDGCPADGPVTFCFVPGLGHGVWGSAAATAWAFFKARP